MLKQFLIICIAIAGFVSCSEDTSESSTMHQVPGQHASDSKDLKSRALDENDRWGRVNSTLVTLQEEFNKSAGKVEGQGKVTVYLDEHFTMMLRNEFGEDVIDTKVNLKDLNPEGGGMSLIPDMAADEYPGLELHVIEGKPGVVIEKNGEKESTERSLKIYMATRENIERIAPAMVQALNIVHGKYE